MSDQRQDHECIGISLAELKELTRETVESAVNSTLVKLGIDASDPLEMQRDFQSLRDTRKAIEAVRSRAGKTIVGVIFGLVVAVMGLGVKEYIKHLITVR